MQCRSNNGRPPIQRGFTLVEIMIVVAIIGLLMGLLIGGLRSAIGTARKTKEMNGLRGVHAGWYQYSTSYEEQLLPGFISTSTQQDWSVTYPNLSGTDLDRGFSQTYPWRMSRFVDNPYGTLLGYLDLEAADSAPDLAPSVNWDGTPTPPAWAAGVAGLPGSQLALQPAFAYNAYYVGGWYDGPGAPRFANAEYTKVDGRKARGSLVATRLAGINRTSEVIVFASGTFRAVGNYRTTGNREDNVPGSAWIVPPALGATEVWEPAIGEMRSVSAAWSPLALIAAPQGGTDTGVLGVRVDQGVPVRRYGNSVATVRAEGSVESLTIGAMMDMRRWIDIADSPEFRHLDQ